MKIAILGTVPASRRVAPYGDEAWEIWVCSPGNSQAAAPPRISKWFELHAIVDMLGEENKAWCPQYFAWLKAQSFPVIMQERNEHVPSALPFPRNRLLARWGENETRTNWFTSSIAWMTAYAIDLMRPLDGEPAENAEIGIFGVDMAATEEHYSWQKAGCLRFVEIAKELGITVTIPLESSLAIGVPLYGYAESSRLGRTLMVRSIEMKENIRNLEQQVAQATQQICFFKGALEQILFDQRTHVSGNEDAEIDFEDDAKANVAHLEKAAAELPTPPAMPLMTHIPTAADFGGSPEAAALLNGSGKAHIPPVVAAAATRKTKSRSHRKSA